jgi:hypothetical protein
MFIILAPCCFQAIWPISTLNDNPLRSKWYDLYSTVMTASWGAIDILVAVDGQQRLETANQR